MQCSRIPDMIQGPEYVPHRTAIESVEMNGSHHSPSYQIELLVVLVKKVLSYL